MGIMGGTGPRGGIAAIIGTLEGTLPGIVVMFGPIAGIGGMPLVGRCIAGKPAGICSGRGGGLGECGDAADAVG